MLNRLIIATFVSALLAACVTTPEPTGELKPSTAWVAYSDEWRAEAEAVFAAATQFVQRSAQERPEHSWVVILDIDETVLNNVGYQIERDRLGLGFTEPSWYAWTQRESATLVPGAKAFINAVNQAGGHVALVTNRQDTEQLATENNLAALGLLRHNDFRVFLTRSRPASSKKAQRFALVPQILAVQGFPNVDVVAYIGDGKGDKPEELGDGQFFCIDQGAMYGEPCAAVPGSGT